MLADWIFIWPEPSRKGLTHENYRARIRIVCLRNVATLLQRNSHDSQISGSDEAHRNLWLVCHRNDGLSFHGYRLRRTSLQRQAIDRTGELRAGQRADLLQHMIEESVLLRNRG